MKSMIKSVTVKELSGIVLRSFWRGTKSDNVSEVKAVWQNVRKFCNLHRRVFTQYNAQRKISLGFLTGASAALILSKSAVCASEAASLQLRCRTISKAECDKVLKEADILYSQNQLDDLYEFLKQFEDVDNAQICWRLARAACDKAKHCDPKSKEREVLMHEGFKHAERSIAFDDKCGACHRWYAVMLNYVGDYEGNKEKIKYSYIVKEHFQKAIQLNQKDATSMYCLGQWCYFFADMSWYTRQIAALIFASPPTATFQEALDYFLLAEKTDPNFYSMNHLMLARTYLKLNNKVMAREHLIKARDLPVKSPDDRQAHAESTELLNRL